MLKIGLQEVPIRDVVNGYFDSDDNGTRGYSGKLNIRPPYQRDYIYNEEQRNAVVETVMNNFPLNTMYWAKNGEDDYELMDGQQRTISICQYYNGDFSLEIGDRIAGFSNLTAKEQEDFLNYKLMVYVCEGTDKEKLDWFKVINIAGLKLEPQELRNAIYTGEWLADAKKYFSKRNCPASKLYKDYLKGKRNRQAFLETSIKWIADRDGTTIEGYMAKHQHDKNCNELWLYFQQVMNWVKTLYPEENYREEMKKVEWGIYYNKYANVEYDANELEQQVKKLMMDDDVTSKSGIYEYLFDGKEKHLSIRAFTDSMKRSAYERQNGFCAKCNKHFDIKGMEADHITPWSKGGKTTAENCKMLCTTCNREKSDT